MATALGLMAALILLVRKTRLGVGMRATAENLDVARLMGININRTIMATFAVGGALAAVAGSCGAASSARSTLSWALFRGSSPLSQRSSAGRLHSGRHLWRLHPGACRSPFRRPAAADLFCFRDAFVFGTLILILLVMPNGLLGKPWRTAPDADPAQKRFWSSS